MAKKRKPGERRTITGGPYGDFVQYFLPEEEWAKYRAMPPDPYWENNSRPIRPPEYQSIQNKKWSIEDFSPLAPPLTQSVD